jgi:hypothetical protein
MGGNKHGHGDSEQSVVCYRRRNGDDMPDELHRRRGARADDLIPGHDSDDHDDQHDTYNDRDDDDHHSIVRQHEDLCRPGRSV